MARPLQVPCLTEAALRTDLWPLWPYLPLIHASGLGYFIDSEVGLWFVRGCLFLTSPEAEIRQVSAHDIVNMQQEGWRVD